MTYGIKADGSECRHHPQYCDCYVDDLRAAIRDARSVVERILICDCLDGMDPPESCGWCRASRLILRALTEGEP